MNILKIIIVWIKFVLIFSIDHGIVFPNDTTLEINSTCHIKLPDGGYTDGICSKISECYEIEKQIRRTNYNHTVCGYKMAEQIVCCPWKIIKNEKLLMQTIPEVGITEINLDTDYKCIVKSSGGIGVLKFIEDCPKVGENINYGEQDFCNHEICKGLVCCPLPKVSGRHNAVCVNVDRPDVEINFRLNFNMPCTVKGLNNVFGTYQSSCDAYKRNEISSENLIRLCKDKYCTDYYCCPILKPTDRKYCTRRGKKEFAEIEFIGPNCTDSLTNLPGRCRVLHSCPAFRQGRQKMDKCGKDCCTDFYCCPEEDYTFQTISDQKCSGYKNTMYRKQVIIETLHEMESNNTQCSLDHFSFAGGIKAKPGALPFMAALGYIQQNSSKLLWNCGGSLISEKFVLTAAHCLETKEFGQVKVIRLGSLYLENMTKSDECAEDFGVKRVIFHPSYNCSYVYNDIGLIELDREVKFNYHMRPICLPTSSEVPYNLVGMGWGTLDSGGEKRDTLYYSYLESYSYEECNKSYTFNLNSRVLNGIDDNTQFCVKSHEDIKSTCTGDSGGPIISKMYEYDGMNEVHGISSFSTVCGFADSPSVYTKVFPYVKWIEGLAWS